MSDGQLEFSELREDVREADEAPAPDLLDAEAESPRLVDATARLRFQTEWDRNFAVSANAGSGKTTAISERLAAMALDPLAAPQLRRTAVVTYTKKAASQIGQRARQVLLRRLTEAGRRDLTPLDHLERVFFGTIHSFCLKLAQTYGQTLGVNLQPTLVAEDDESLWEEFVEQDAMQFQALTPDALAATQRHLVLDELFELARQLDATTAAALLARRPVDPPPIPSRALLDQLLALPAKGSGAANVRLSQQRAREWQQAWVEQAAFLPLYEPAGKSAAVVALAAQWMAPLKRWLAGAGAALAAELSERYRAWRFARGVQTYPDQIDAALAVLRDDVLLDRIRRDGWRVVLDEAQDTDPQQFAVLVEIARPLGAARGSWPDAGGPGPRPGHFCLVGDGQQSIYGNRADIGNFLRHVEAFGRGDAGELLKFQVTFRAPRAVIDVLNTTLPAAFGPGCLTNLGVPPEEGAPAPLLQVPYEPLAAGPMNVDGRFGRLPLQLPARVPERVDEWLAEEARQLAAWLQGQGPAGLGATTWGEVAILAPRNDWLVTVRKALEGVGFEVALQTRRTRCGDNPAYAWISGMLAVCADPENSFEWVGVLREVFGLSDALLAAELRRCGSFSWEQPDRHPEPLAVALTRLRPLILSVNDEGRSLARFATELVAAGGLVDKAWALDPSGSLAGEIERLMARAAELGLKGGGPRAWLQEVLAELDEGRASGKPTPHAINLLTSHSAKGLEWTAVIVVGFWRGIGKPPDRGLKLVKGPEGAPQVFFDRASLPADMDEARNRERVRELTRLLYVTLTRPRHTLVIPWADGFGGRQRESPSFAQLWGADLGALPDWQAPAEPGPGEPSAVPPVEPAAVRADGVAAPLLPVRILPHELASHLADPVRGTRHESTLDQPVATRAEEAIDYGLWWHESVELLPWAGDARAADAHLAAALERAAALGLADRAREELAALRGSAAWESLTHPRWTRQAELAVLAPLRTGAWVDGVVDLVLHDEPEGELGIIDWKTNRRRAGESPQQLLERLANDYAAQLRAYGECLQAVFPGRKVWLRLYASAAGDWIEIDHRHGAGGPV